MKMLKCKKGNLMTSHFGTLLQQNLLCFSTASKFGGEVFANTSSIETAEAMLFSAPLTDITSSFSQKLVM